VADDTHRTGQAIISMEWEKWAKVGFPDIWNP
jgi:hypothetical protein